MKTDFFTFDNTTYTINIGQNAQENTDMVSSASQHDMWFHVDNSPSCHVILTCIHSKSVPRQVLKRCAYMCKIHSKAKFEPLSQIIYTRVANVQVTEIPGRVVASDCKVIRI
jgi:predicted ribosome quality control (RQC) complex YloA/Tae2 family protein